MVSGLSPRNGVPSRKQFERQRASSSSNKAHRMRPRLFPPRNPPSPRERLADVQVAERTGRIPIQPVVDLVHVKSVKAGENSHAVPGLINDVCMVHGQTSARQEKKGQSATGRQRRDGKTEAGKIATKPRILLSNHTSNSIDLPRSVSGVHQWNGRREDLQTQQSIEGVMRAQHESDKCYRG